MSCQGQIEVKCQDGPFQGRTLIRASGSFEEGTLLYFDKVTYRIEWDNATWKWVAYCVDNGSI